MVLDFEVFDDLERMLAEAPYLFIGVMNDDGSQQEVLAVADNESDMSKFILEVWSQKPEEIKEKYKDTFITYVGARHQFPFKAVDLCGLYQRLWKCGPVSS